MKIVIIGPGALGTLLAASLKTKSPAKKSPDLWLLDYKSERAEVLNDHGLIFEKRGRRSSCRVKATTDPQKIGQADVIFLCVKYPDFTEGLKQAEKISNQDTLLITLQNGIGHLKYLTEKKRQPKIVLGVTALGANLVSPGHVVHAGSGLTRIGFLKAAGFGTSLQLAQVCNLLNDCGMETAIVDNILDYVWTKLLINVGINALTAINGCPNGGLLESAELQATMSAAVKEGETVAKAAGISLPDDPLTMTVDVCRKTSQNISSMLQDVRNRRLTEIDSINGALLAAAKKHGIPVPVNEELVAKIKEIESTY